MSTPHTDLQALQQTLTGHALPTTQQAQELARIAAVRKARAALDRNGTISGGAWRQLSVQMRSLLLTICTDRRDCERDACQPWHTFSEQERHLIGAQARQWRRELEGAEWLRA